MQNHTRQEGNKHSMKFPAQVYRQVKNLPQLLVRYKSQSTKNVRPVTP